MQYNMFFLIRGCTFSACRYYGNIINKARSLTLYPLSFNFIVNSAMCKLFSSEKTLFPENESIKRYLNHLMNAYQNKDKGKNESISGILQIQMVPILLDKKIKIVENIKTLSDFASKDEEMKKLIKEEEFMYEQELAEIDKELLNVVLQSLVAEDYEHVIMEIVPGVGGQEAMLFAMDLFNMYINYLNYLEYKHEVMELSKTDVHGLRKAVILISNNKAYKKLKYEGGVHRVQRIPLTERTGRMHTSTAIVAIYPEPRDIDITIPEKDLKIEAKRASGAGGQHVNTTDSAIRITHIPTGTVVTCQTNRSQLQNKKLALIKLKSILHQEKLDNQVSLISDIRKKQIGTKLRNEKIRTYNFSQDRVTDHRLSNGTMHNLKGFLKDGASLVELQDRLYKDMQQQALLEIMKKIESQLK